MVVVAVVVVVVAVIRIRRVIIIIIIIVVVVEVEVEVQYVSPKAMRVMDVDTSISSAKNPRVIAVAPDPWKAEEASPLLSAQGPP